MDSGRKLEREGRLLMLESNSEVCVIACAGDSIKSLFSLNIFQIPSQDRGWFSFLTLYMPGKHIFLLDIQK